MTRPPRDSAKDVVSGISIGIPTLRDAETTRRPGAARFPSLIGFCAEHPLRAPVRHPLDGDAAVLIGRGPVDREEATGKSVLLVDDPRMSRQHVLLSPVGEGWRIQDLGSLNGSMLNGERLERAVLVPGDVIELGRTLLVYSDAASPQPAVAGTGFFTYSARHAAALASLEAVTRTALSVLLLGETGTGKEVLAHEIHRLSGRPGPYVAVNCGALPESLVASELFGYRRGAFSGAVEEREGLVRASSGGTLFLDEVADLPASGQAALLRVLQEHEVLAVGGTRPLKVDLRVIAATHRDLDALVEAGSFRADLLARLSGFTFRLPPLRERREDIGGLIATLLSRLGSAAAQARFSMKAARALFLAEWPRNVRELEQALTSAVALARGQLVDVDHLPDSLKSRSPRGPAMVSAISAAPALQDHELRQTLVALLEQHRGNLAEVARAMAKAPTQIRRWLKRLGLDPDAYRG